MMSDCKICVHENGSLVHYSCYQVKVLLERWKREFRERNGTDKILRTGGIDRMYNSYCEKLNKIIDNCNCEDDLKCKNCDDKYHDGFFCRCEDRNIKLAKKHREMGISPWNKLSYEKDQTCNFCQNPDSILTKNTCCTGCSKLKSE